MNRSRRYNQPTSKNFVAGGVYDGQQQYSQQQQQYQQQQQAQAQQAQQTSAQQYQVQYQTSNNQQQQKSVDQQPKAVPQQQQQNVAQEQKSQQVVETMQIGDGTVSEDGKSLFKKLFANRKKSSVRTREKKIRQNRRLRKAITPKNALMALNEVKGIQMSDFNVTNSQTGGFIATVSINNSQYEGRGHSKAAAKNNACEKALRDYVISKMINNPRLSKSNSENNVNAMDVAENGTEEANAAAANSAGEEEDDVPMVNLASFALFKLFSEWESEGFVIPEMHRTAQNAATNDANGTAAPAEPKKAPPIRTELPANWETMHPSTLLCMMRPGLTYQFLGTVGEKPNETQNISVTVDGTEFKGTGRSKKNARRNAAVDACNTLFGTNFVLEGTV